MPGTTFKIFLSLLASCLFSFLTQPNCELEPVAAVQSAENPQGRAAEESAANEVPSGLLEYLKSTLDEDTLSLIEEANFRLDRFDLNRDGLVEYFVVGFCSPTGNCELWVMEKAGQEYRTLLKTSLVSAVCVRSTRTARYLDLETRSHGSAFDSGVSVFKFDGKNYEESESYEVRWEYDDTGKWRQVEGPKKQTKCRELFTQYSHPPRKTGHRTTPK